jgi:hypothetical protein
MINGYKLFRLRKDGTLGPLFIGAKLRVPVGVWQEAQGIRVKGFAYRPGWHACAKPEAPHLSKRGRVWCEVSLKGVQAHHRPEAQGGLWYVCEWLRVERIIVEGEE